MPYSNDKPVKKYGTPEPVMAKGYLKMSGKIVTINNSVLS